MKATEMREKREGNETRKSVDFTSVAQSQVNNAQQSASVLMAAMQKGMYKSYYQTEDG